MNLSTGFADFHPVIQNQALGRPGILMRAAKAGQGGWQRGRDLPRLLRSHKCPAHDQALKLLRAEEERLNGLRLLRAPSYDMQRHVLIMIALLAEMHAAAVSVPGTATPERP
ncbi:DUF6477 family protein [Paracoccus onubensis]|uniref:Uncharacterized protein n=1 Tax=Paracoccus onubensis TaxID=1675788 RepID=A0A418SLZ3_9RHOB|nr:DUF6477 family protein [Paracoccus onubensis]RJE81954.1 hypothetical protein D3P04_22110 [Paracoccus onubensis]